MKATFSDYKIEVNSSVDCSTRNVIYLLGCSKCPMQYIGENKRMLKERFSEHIKDMLTPKTSQKQQECTSTRRDTVLATYR